MEHENFGKCLDAKFDVRVVTPNDGYHYFFGYYDLNAYHENGRYFIGDGYPRPDHCRHIYLYDTVTDECEIILKDYSVEPPAGDLRCDLHNRWNVKGDKFSFDSTRNGRREICEVDVSSLMYK